jgi:hypothetical protein
MILPRTAGHPPRAERVATVKASVARAAAVADASRFGPGVVGCGQVSGEVEVHRARLAGRFRRSVVEVS